MGRYLGRVPITSDTATRHNQVYDAALVKGLDGNCQVGQGGLAYWHEGRQQVQTWLGTVLSTRASRKGRTVKWSRGRREFKGQLDSDWVDTRDGGAVGFYFERIK